MCNDVLNKKYKEEGYFKECPIENDKSFECERCGCMIKSKSNMAKHLRTVNVKDLIEKEHIRMPLRKCVLHILQSNK